MNDGFSRRGIGFVLVVFGLCAGACALPWTSRFSARRVPHPQVTDRSAGVASATFQPSATSQPAVATVLPLSSPTLLPSPTPMPTATATAAPLPQGWRAPQSLTPGPVRLHRLRMVDSKRGWALGTQQGEGPRVLVTDDGARTWREVSPPLLPPDVQADAVQTLFWDATTAWVAYGHEAAEPSQLAAGVWVTHDRGTTWTWAPIPWPEDMAIPWFRPGPLTAVDAQRAWLLVHLDAGMGHDYALLVSTTDGGQRWDVLADPSSPRAADLMTMFTSDLAFAPDGRYGWATKDAGPIAAAVVVSTRDGGRSWRTHAFIPSGDDEAFCSTRDPHVWAPGEGVVLVLCLAEDAPGHRVFVARWSMDVLPVEGAPTAEDASMMFPTADEGYVAVYPANTGASTRRTLLFVTTDGGATWASAGEYPWTGLFSWLPGGEGWALADDGLDVRVMHTTDRGRTWEPLPMPKIIEKEP